MLPSRGDMPVLLMLVPALSQTPRAASQYVNPKICASCHREIADNYGRTGMARSFFGPAAGNTLEDYTHAPEYYHALSDSHYAMVVRGGRYFQRRWQLDA